MYSTTIYDGAVRIKKNMYQADTFHCLSFHIRKVLAIAKGGMILTDDREAVDWFKRARYSGRRACSYHDDNFDMLGWNFYMMPDYPITSSKKQNGKLIDKH